MVAMTTVAMTTVAVVAVTVVASMTAEMVAAATAKMVAAASVVAAMMLGERGRCERYRGRDRGPSKNSRELHCIACLS